jgi:dihydrodipicolinate synthase/N-acetylneuraminate lyase
MPDYPLPPDRVLKQFRGGLVIPAHPLALDDDGRFDESSQRALTRYYLAAGAGGIAVGVHTTQFEIREPKHGLLQSVLELAVETVRSTETRIGNGDGLGRTVLIAGVCGKTAQAVGEATLARETGYHAGLLSLAALGGATEDQLIAHADRVAQELPIVGFYLQAAVGGRRLDYNFWRRFADIPNVIGIKVAPFNRYATQDVLRAVAHSGRAQEIALYTGNDDHIILDLASTWEFPADDGSADHTSVHFCGGLLGHWACWTRPAIRHLELCRSAQMRGEIDSPLQVLAVQVTEANAALFDVANNFAGCIAGIHYVLRSQGLMRSLRCLNPREQLSLGQAELIDAVRVNYPHLVDDGFVTEHLETWLR